MRRLIRPLAETLTLQRLGIDEQLRRTLSSTDPVESMIETCRRTSRNVKRWQNGDMCLRWTAAGMLEAERQSARSSATSTWRSSRSPSSFTSPAERAAVTVAASPTEPAATLLDRQLITGLPPRIPRRPGHPLGQRARTTSPWVFGAALG